MGQRTGALLGLPSVSYISRARRSNQSAVSSLLTCDYVESLDYNSQDPLFCGSDVLVRQGRDAEQCTYVYDTAIRSKTTCWKQRDIEGNTHLTPKKIMVEATYEHRLLAAGCGVNCSESVGPEKQLPPCCGNSFRSANDFGAIWSDGRALFWVSC
ncbi:hypothetical protein HispidOSU_024844 [Sigmodon hispidus]